MDWRRRLEDDAEAAEAWADDLRWLDILERIADRDEDYLAEGEETRWAGWLPVQGETKDSQQR